MAMVSIAASAGEALALGLATGPVCLASCGPVVVPWMLVQAGGVRGNVRGLSLFLAARLCGYLTFAAAAWGAGFSLPQWAMSRWVSGGVQLLVAAALVVYAAGWPRRGCRAAQARQKQARQELVQISKGPAMRRGGAAVLGYLTGISLCPPFLIAGVRAAQAASLPVALVFFTVFFAGTAIWFVPFIALSLAPRTAQLLTVARMTAVLLACYYGILGTTTLLVRISHVKP